MKYIWIWVLFCLTLFAFDKDAVFVTQYDENRTITAEDAYLIVVYDKSEYYDVLDFLDTKPKGYMQNHHIRFVNDISGMPDTIYTLFVQPKFKRLPYELYLVRDMELSKSLAYKDDKITIYDLKRNSIDYIDASELSKVLP